MFRLWLKQTVEGNESASGDKTLFQSELCYCIMWSNSSQITADYNKLQKTTTDYSRVQQITADYVKLQQIRTGYSRLQQTTTDYDKFQGQKITLLFYHCVVNIDSKM